MFSTMEKRSKSKAHTFLFYFIFFLRKVKPRALTFLKDFSVFFFLHHFRRDWYIFFKYGHKLANYWCCFLKFNIIFDSLHRVMTRVHGFHHIGNSEKKQNLWRPGKTKWFSQQFRVYTNSWIVVHFDTDFWLFKYNLV